jgi:hypothetical protein
VDTPFKKHRRRVSVSKAGSSHPRIFVSHSAKDNDFGKRLISDLQRTIGDNDAVWYDVSGLQGGDEWWDKIVEELTKSDVFIIVLSPNSVVSRWVRRELDTAINEGKRIIPVLYQPCQVRADLKTIQMISFLHPKDYETAFNELLTTLGLSTPPPPPPVPGSGVSSTDQTSPSTREITAEKQAPTLTDVAPPKVPEPSRGIPHVRISLPKGISHVSPVRIALLAGLAVLLIVGGVIAFSLISSGNQGKQAPGSATMTANTQLTATVQANANAVATIEAQTYATATVTTNATATAYAPTQTAIDATVTASQNRFPPRLGTLALNDQLRDNTQGYGWDENANCAFSGGAYHVIGTAQYANTCNASSTNYSNFAFQVQLTIIKGGCGGLVFRNNIGFYFFEVCTDGIYGLASYTSTDAPWLISPTPSAAINTHLNQTNVLAVIANGSKFDLYVNLEHITSVNDSTYSHGQIGFAANGILSGQSGSEVEVAFSNAKVWTL